MGRIKLVKPSVDDREAYMAFFEDWIQSGETIVPWVVERDPSDFAAYVDFLYAADSEEKLDNDEWVPHSTYWLKDEEAGIVGAANFRHRLNDKLLDSGGHIGYGVRPSERRKGYASIQLAEMLRIAREHGLTRVLLVCDRENEASERTIRKHGGVLEDERMTSDGHEVKRFWIALGEGNE
ncbi:GNAT family N-acetyltransferase [Paenibacillus sp. LHD-117]|uniref:GNAT family N-acetyltransferase n=1 Tax=Paenibacillus sp. LHD-117 TaxID=3071412 RepID=UPI0027E14749|nr:GNAT family N-acetyltransferase [Paenibacillus sp. LHD-117]MDQ6420053.1 GNAT family N-acetyltransferase [Paenibacillus sp. LHD-117]